MASFQSVGIVALLIMVSPPILRMTPGMLSGPNDLFLPITANRFLIMLILMLKGLSE